MSNLFDIIEGNYTSFDANSITDSSANWKENQFQNWYCIINDVEYKITSNNSTQLFFNNSLSSVGNYKIIFVYRNYLLELESDFSDTSKISNGLIDKKYNQSNTDISNKIFSYIRNNFKCDFNPTENILNSYQMQRPFAYYMLYLIYFDLMISFDSFNNGKRDLYYNQYSITCKDGLSLLQLDFNKDGEASWDEKKTSASTSFFYR